MVEETRESPISEAPAAAEKPLEPPLSDASLNPTSTSGVSTETLAARRSSPRPVAVAAPDRRSFSQLLAGAMASPVFSAAVPCFLAPDSPGFKGQFAMTHQAVLATVTAQAQMQLQAMHSASSEVSTNIFSKPISPVPDQKPQSKQTVVNTNSVGDGYNWRKYGQKLVKSSENSRSYYKCTDPNCSAKKKVERCHDGRVTEMTYMGQHNHGPPQQTKCSRERGPRSNGPPGESESLDIPSSEMNDPDSSNAKMDQISGKGTPEQQLFCSSDCEGDARIRIKEELGDGPESKRRLVQNIATFSPSPRVLKEPKVIVHEESDVGRAGDGYKWRKYGQKIVKGNPNPRSYYRCSHNGCPVRKHVERASDDVKATIVTYEGKHNHDQPSPMINSDLPASPLPLASMAMPYEQLQPPDNSPVDQKPSAISPTDIGSGSTIEKASELGESFSVCWR